MNKNNYQALKFAFRMTFCQDATPVMVLMICLMLTVFLVTHGFAIGWVFFPLFFVIYVTEFIRRYHDWFFIVNNDVILQP